MARRKFKRHGITVLLTGFEFALWTKQGGMDGIMGTADHLALNFRATGRFENASQCIEEDGRPAAWIEDIKVDPGARGKGLGTRLLRTALDVLREEGIKQVWLSASSEDIPRRVLLRWYERHGFGLAPKRCQQAFGGRGGRKHWTRIMATSLEE